MDVLILILLLLFLVIGLLGLGLPLLGVFVLLTAVLAAWVAIDQGPAALQRRIPEFVAVVEPHARLIAAGLSGLIGGEVLRRLFQRSRNP